MPDVTRVRPHRVAIVGGTFSGNKGAASMLQAVVDRLPEVAGPTRFVVLSAYAGEDRDEPGAGAVRIVKWAPVNMILDLPLAILVALARLLRLPMRQLTASRSLRALADADVVADVAGISFVDGRGLVVLVYNVLMPLMGVLVGTPVVKCSQAVGPFTDPRNRAAARWTLARMERVYARGEQTAAHLRELGLDNVEEAGDLAFVLGLPDEGAVAGARRWPDGDGPRVAVVPSAVVEAYCDEQGIDYVGLTAELVEGLAAGGHRVLLFPHSARGSAGASRMNDLPVCRAVADRVGVREGVTFLPDQLSPHELRGVIASADVLVAARFHAMISALATGTPVLVTGWSHKYTEVLRQFGLEEWQIPYEDLTLKTLSTGVHDLLARREQVSAAILQGLPAVQATSMRNFDALRDVLRR